MKSTGWVAMMMVEGCYGDGVTMKMMMGFAMTMVWDCYDDGVGML